MRRLHISKPRDVDAVRTATDRSPVRKPGHLTRRSRSVMVIHHVTPEQPAGVAESFGKAGAARIQEQTNGFNRRGAQEDHASLELELARILSVNDPDPASPATFRVIQHLGNDAVRPKRQPSRLPRGGEGGSDAVEVRAGHTSAFAWSTVVTGEPAVVILRENGGATNGHHALAPERIVNLLASVLLDDRHRHRWQEVPVRKLRETFFRASHANESLDVRVPRRDIGIPNGPIVAVTITGIRLEIEVAPAVDLPAPGNRPSAHLAAPKPAERSVRRIRVGIFMILDEELVSQLITRITLALHRMVTLEQRAITPAAEVHLVRLHMFHEILLWIDRPTRFEHERPEAALTELLCGPAAGDTGAHDNGVV